MKRRHRSDLGPGFLVVAGIILSTLAAVRVAESGWTVPVGPLVLVFAVVGAGA
jgi:hypothetical protein